MRYALLIGLNLYFSFSALGSQTDQCKAIWGLPYFPPGWTYSTKKALQIANQGPKQKAEMVAVVEAIRLFETSPPELYQLLAILSSLGRSKIHAPGFLNKDDHPLRRGFNNDEIIKKWVIVGFDGSGLVLSYRYPEWTRWLEKTSVRTKDWLTHAADSIPEFKPALGSKPNDQVLEQTSELITKLNLPPDWPYQLARHSAMIRYTLAEEITKALSKHHPEVSSDGSISQVLKVKAIIDNALEGRTPDDPLFPWVNQILTQYLNLWPPGPHTTMITQFFAYAVIVIADEIVRDVQLNRDQSVSNNLDLKYNELIIANLTYLLSKDQLLGPQQLPILLALTASTSLLGEFPSFNQTRESFRQGIIRQLKAMADD